MRLFVRESGELLGNRIREADTFYQRFRGLMLTEGLPEGHGLHIRPCRSVHSFFMKYPIDVLHLDECGTIVGIERELKPGKLGTSFRGTRSVVELPAGTISQAQIAVGQCVLWE